MTKKNDYDAIIIGAGIGGLVCGCYLAKAGLKTLIVEKNANPGGCCTSFTRGGFKFDACVHFLGSLRKNGIVTKILQDLNMQDSIKILRHDPSDTILSKDYKFSFWNNINKTIDQLQHYFPSESKSIVNFFSFVEKVEGYDFLELRNMTFANILDKYFKDERLKALLGITILGNAALPPSRVSAIRAMTLYKEFMLDGGYYIPNGIQDLPGALARKFIGYGGRILYSALVEKIITQNNKAKGIITEQGSSFATRYLISNADARHTFLDLVGHDLVPQSLKTTISNLEPSMSMFALYLGLKNMPSKFPAYTNVWYLSGYNLDELYRSAVNKVVTDVKWFLAYCNPDEKTLVCLFNAPYINKSYWGANKTRVAELLLKKIDTVFPETSDAVCCRNSASPDTIYRWTSNYHGAAYGWAGTVDQFSVTGLSQITPIKNLYLVGHWATLVQGVSGVAYLGKSTATMILKRNK